MLPMTGLAELMGWMPYARLAPRAIAGLLEMAADDYAARIHGPQPVAQSLVKLASSGCSPTCTFAFAADEVRSRIGRLLNGGRNSRWSALATGALVVVALVAPISIVATV
jgi:hypothetical protein